MLDSFTITDVTICLHLSAWNVENVFESFTIKELIICLQYHAWFIHIYQFTIYLQFISCSFTIRNNTYRYTMLLSNAENIDHMRRRLHKRWYMVSNAHKLISSINIYPSPENVSDGLLEPCNNCRTTWNYISLIFKWAVTEKLVMALYIFRVYSWKYSSQLFPILVYDNNYFSAENFTAL